MSIGSTHANNLFNVVLRQTNMTAPTALWMSLHTADPGTTGANESADGTYARVNVTTAFGAPTAGVGSNTSVIEFAALTTGGTYTHYGLWSAVTTGTFYEGHDINPDKAVGAGEIPRFAIGAITYTVSAA